MVFLRDRDVSDKGAEGKKGSRGPKSPAREKA